ncbi:unnamed protein product [Haemonchus placei]|uniref:Uncharacterized protein n=1 Tax=Haemonchus placei TaxID=6290 RepID=A0A0N4W6M4_HAEPC|nr:unnamed protein product [Haemonchus placei]
MSIAKRGVLELRVTMDEWVDTIISKSLSLCALHSIP